jgi:putative transcriptional regulator
MSSFRSLLSCALLASGSAFVPMSDRRSITSLFSKKSPDRARMERVFEESMGDDWRVFRAKLVAHEQTEARHAAEDWHRSTPRETIEEKGQMFGSELSSILFHGGSPTVTQRKESSYGATDLKKLSKAEQRALLMKGDTIGVPLGQVQVQDPFASPAEKVCQVKPDDGLNKHRWAHPINHIEEGAVMIASEKLGGVFQQTVLLVVDHHEKTGTTAVVINR